MSRYHQSIADQLRSSGMRVTAPRLAALEWLDTHPHATVEQIHQAVSHDIGSVSKQAIYDILAACLDARLVRQMKPAGHSARFERRTDDNHHHLVCRSCGHIEDADCRAGDPPCMHPADDRGFAVDETEVVFWGLCSSCQSAGESVSTTQQPGSTSPANQYPSGG